MTRILIGLICFGASIAAMAKKPTSDTPHVMLRNGWFNHIDVGIGVSTSGIGFEVAAPVTDWARVRAGAVFRPLDKKSASFGLEVAGLTEENISGSTFSQLANTMERFTGFKPQKRVYMEGYVSMNNFKFLVDVFPFKNNRHWYATVGFFWGNGTLIVAKNTAESMNTLTAVSVYNKMYRRTLENKNPIDLDLGGAKMDNYIEKLRKWGALAKDEKGKPALETQTVEYQYVAKEGGQEVVKTGQVTIQRGSFSEHGISIPMGRYTHDVVAQEDVYYDYSEKLYKEAEGYYGLADGATVDFNDDAYHYQKDANGRYIKKGSIRYKKGEVMHRAGEEFRMIPDENNIVTATGRSNAFKPYIGVGYETSISKNKRTHIAVDAGILLWGGHPSIDISTPIGIDAEGNRVCATYDMTRDLEGFPTSINNYVKSVKRYPVFPEISVRVTHRLW